MSSPNIDGLSLWKCYATLPSEAKGRAKTEQSVGKGGERRACKPRLLPHGRGDLADHRPHVRLVYRMSSYQFHAPSRAWLNKDIDKLVDLVENRGIEDAECLSQCLQRTKKDVVTMYNALKKQRKLGGVANQQATRGGGAGGAANGGDPPRHAAGLPGEGG